MDRILLVEDEQHISISLAEALRAAGFAVCCESEGRAAITVSNEIELSAAIVDLELPDCSGEYVAQHLRAQFPAMPIIGCTGCNSKSLSESLAHAGITVLEKPVDELRLVKLPITLQWVSLLREETAHHG